MTINNNKMQTYIQATKRVLLPSWLKMYDENYVALLDALIYDPNTADLRRLEDLAEEILETLFQSM